MLIEVLAVGRIKAGPEQVLYDRYSDRFGKTGRPLGLSGPVLKTVQEGRVSDAKARKSEEARALLSKTGTDTRIVTLDETGKDISSNGFSELLFAELEMGTRTLAFAIGGADGHGEEMRSRAFRSIRFGSLTWPHQIARIMLVEQLYRAMTIRSGHPYHRE